MSWAIPSNIARLQSNIFVSSKELEYSTPDDIIRYCSSDLANKALTKLISECVTVEPVSDDVFPTNGKKISLDTYIISPHELHKILSEARDHGERDALAWITSKNDHEEMKSLMTRLNWAKARLHIGLVDDAYNIIESVVSDIEKLTTTGTL